MSKPKQYTQGWVEFYKLRFRVTPDVLIPRPETELLVDEMLKEVNRQQALGNKKIIVLDIGTGAGNIAISLAKNLILHPWGANVKLIATDVSTKALKVAQTNAKLHGIGNQIKFIESDLLSNPDLEPIIDHTNPSLLIIVTNLPYIPSERIPYLDSSVKDFEPYIALNGGPDGFDLYRKLFQQVKEKGWKVNLIVGEVDYTHGELAYLEASKYFPNAQTEVRTDLAHKQRILVIKAI